jgi:hypothetical protein
MGIINDVRQKEDMAAKARAYDEIQAQQQARAIIDERMPLSWGQERGLAETFTAPQVRYTGVEPIDTMGMYRRLSPEENTHKYETLPAWGSKGGATISAADMEGMTNAMQQQLKNAEDYKKQKAYIKENKLERFY